MSRFCCGKQNRELLLTPVVVDGDCVFAQVNIAFGNAGTFCYTHSCSKEHSHDGEPMAVCRGLGNKTQEILLLRFGECDPPFRLVREST